MQCLFVEPLRILLEAPELMSATTCRVQFERGQLRYAQSSAKGLETTMDLNQEARSFDAFDTFAVASIVQCLQRQET